MPPRRFTAKRALAFLGVGSVAAIGAVASFPQLTAKQPVLGNDPRLASSLATIADASVNPNSIPTRAEAIAKLRQGTSASPFDILVVGGGATGSAVALDAASRGMRVALVEKGDFAGETSSKSTKLIHGGVRYLEKAVFGCDFKQLKLVFEALSERGVLLRQAPHLCHTLPTVIPCYSYFDAGFYWAGMKAYDVLAAVGGAMLSPSKFIGREETLEVLPSLRRERPTEPRSPLVGSIVYYDGSMNDARLNLGAALTAAALGGVISNYLEVTKIQPIGSAGHPLSRVTVKDVRTGEAFDVHSRLVVSAAGPYTDKVLNSIDVGQAAADAPPPRSTIVPSAGAHVTLPAFLTRPANPSAETVALLVPQTSDGRVLFVAPWCGATIAGTTDRAVSNVENPTATQDDINFVLQSVSEAFEVPLTQNDLTSVWCGIRPLAAAFEGDGSTQSVVREHRIVTGENGIASVSGGKWTTFRRMGYDTVEAVIGSRADPELSKQFSAAVSSSLSSMLPFVGSPRWSDDSRLHAASDFGRRCKRADVTRETEEHLWTTYGIRAHSVLEIATRAESEKRWPAAAAVSSSGGGWFGSKKAKDSTAPSAARVTPAGTLDRVLPSYPILSAEVVYAARHEMCVTPADFLCRRTRLAFVDAKAALAAIPKVTAILADEHKWSPERAKAEAEAAVAYINTFVPPPQRTPLQTAADRNKQHGSVVVAPSTA